MIIKLKFTGINCLIYNKDILSIVVSIYNLITIIQNTEYFEPYYICQMHIFLKYSINQTKHLIIWILNWFGLMQSYYI